MERDPTEPRVVNVQSAVVVGSLALPEAELQALADGLASVALLVAHAAPLSKTSAVLRDDDVEALRNDVAPRDSEACGLPVLEEDWLPTLRSDPDLGGGNMVRDTISAFSGNAHDAQGESVRERQQR